MLIDVETNFAFLILNLNARKQASLLRANLYSIAIFHCATIVDYNHGAL